ncbi:MAG: sensor histidine kinase [Candidatus Hodarchaeales archaeon]|jgi:signal transduction histidine kinase
MYELEIILTLILVFLLFLSTYYIIHDSKSLVNLSFAFSPFIFAIASIFGVIGYILANDQQKADAQPYWIIGTILLLLTPSGYLFSAKLIYFGNNAFIRIDSIIWYLLTFFSILGVLYIYPIQIEIENIVTWDAIIILLLIGVTIEYIRLYRLDTTWQTKIAFILFGLLLSIFGLGLNIIITMVTSESTTIRQIVPIIGHIFVITAFLVIPESQREVRDWKQLQIQNVEMELFLDLLTHDLTNHLMTSKGYLDLAIEEGKNGDSINLLLLSRTGNIRAIDLLTTVSIFMKTKFDYEYELQPISLHETILDAKKVLLELYPNKNIQIDLINIDESNMILADSLFEHLILNLLTNAVKNDSNSVVKVKVERKQISPNKILLIVVDHGKGIPLVERKGIFARYTQFRKEGKGSGLGLFIVNTLVKRYRGTITIQNTVSNDYTKGTCFKLELYCSAP